MIHSNGAPKTGTHLLQNLLRSYKGVPPNQVSHQHTPYKRGVKLENHIHIIRNPRNMMISWHRFTGDTATIINKMPEVIKRAKGFIGWLDNTMTVRFEELLTDPDIINQIGEYLGLEPCKDHFRKSYGGTSTFTGKNGPDFSIWQTFKIDGKLVWTPEVQEAWEHHGGIDLETAWGYDVHKKYVRRVNG